MEQGQFEETWPSDRHSSQLWSLPLRRPRGCEWGRGTPLRCRPGPAVGGRTAAAFALPPAGQFGVWEHSLSSRGDVIVWAAAHGSIPFFPFKTWPAPALIGSTPLSICVPCSSLWLLPSPPICHSHALVCFSLLGLQDGAPQRVEAQLRPPGSFSPRLALACLAAVGSVAAISQQPKDLAEQG